MRKSSSLKKYSFKPLNGINRSLRKNCVEELLFYGLAIWGQWQLCNCPNKQQYIANPPQCLTNMALSILPLIKALLAPQKRSMSWKKCLGRIGSESQPNLQALQESPRRRAPLKMVITWTPRKPRGQLTMVELTTIEFCWVTMEDIEKMTGLSHGNPFNIMHNDLGLSKEAAR